MKCTISAMSGKGVVDHNRRIYVAENVDASRSSQNIEYCYMPIRQAYRELFDEALAEYNAKQKRSDRKIDDYYEKICSGKQEKPFYEVVFQIGNKDDMAAETENGELAKKILNQYMEGFQKRNPNLHVFSAHLHCDESTPHLHIDFIPFTTGSKRGLSKRVSLKRALADQGIAGEGRSDTERAKWIQREKETLAEIMLDYGIEWEQKGEHREHLSVLEYKREQRAKEVAELEVQYEEKKERIQELAPVTQGLEQLAAKYSSRPEEWLPEPGKLETAKNYRDKKILPLVTKLVEMLRTLFVEYSKIKKEKDQYQKKYNDVNAQVRTLRAVLDKEKQKKGQLECELSDYRRIKELLPNEMLESLVRKKMEECERKQKQFGAKRELSK